MRTLRVRAVPGGWLVENEPNAPLAFRSGGAAERKATELAQLHARLGEPVEVIVQDRSGSVTGSAFHAFTQAAP